MAEAHSLDAVAFARALEAADCAPGSPLIQFQRFSRRESCVSIATEATAATTSTVCGAEEHVRVIVRVKPASDADQSCLEWAGDKVCVQVHDVEEDPSQRDARTPNRAGVPGGAHTPGRTPSVARTPARTPNRVPAVGRTPGGQTPARVRSSVPKTFHFDAVYGGDDSQSLVFSHAQPLIDAAVEGSNACIFAYGQTGTGKTHTMIGAAISPGIVPRTVQRIWERIALSPALEWNVYLTYVELYNDTFRDLLASSNQPGQRLLVAQMEEARRAQSAISLRETKNARGGPPSAYLVGSDTFRVPVSSESQLLALLDAGHAARATSATEANERSSRSHAIVTINIESRAASGGVRMGKLHLVDLAGSESLSGVIEKEQTSEAKAINVSLTALCDVLQALSKNARRHPGTVAHPVPFRNHKLTRLLADSLCGRALTLMIATVQTAQPHYRSTIHTLKFASRARDISIHGVLGESLVGVAESAAEPLHARLTELHERLDRREREISYLEQLLSAKEAQGRRELEAQLRTAKKAHEEEMGELRSAYRSSMLEGVRAAAGAAHSAALVEVEAAAREHIERKALLQVMREREGRLDACRKLASTSEALRLEQQDRAATLALTEKDGLALQNALAGWKAEREALTEATRRLEEQRRAADEAEARTGALGRAVADAEAKQVRAIRAAAEGDTGMKAVLSLLAVLDEEVIESSAVSTLKWLRSKLSEVTQTYQAAVAPLIDVLPEARAAPGRRRASLTQDGTRSKRSRATRKAVSTPADVQPTDVGESTCSPVPRAAPAVEDGLRTNHSEVPMSLASIASHSVVGARQELNSEEEALPVISEAVGEPPASVDATEQGRRQSGKRERKSRVSQPADKDELADELENADARERRTTRASARKLSETVTSTRDEDDHDDDDDWVEVSRKSKRSCRSRQLKDKADENNNVAHASKRRTNGAKTAAKPLSPLVQLNASNMPSKRKLFNPSAASTKQLIAGSEW